MSEQVKIEHRFHGPPDSANGGYTCGLVASFLEPDPAVEVTLRSPPPLDRPLTVDRSDGGVELRNGGRLVAEGRPAALPDLELPDPVSLEDAARARESSPLHRHHVFPTCFVCGPRREPGDGLHVTCGPVPGREDELVAAPFETGGEMDAGDGTIRPELVWSVLDCPSGLAPILITEVAVAVLGRLTAELREPLAAGSDYVAIGWPIGRDGRKLSSAAAVLDPESGEAVGVSAATWIELSEPPQGSGS